MKDFRYTQHPLFGKGKAKEELYWHSVIRQAILNNLLYKDIELYGIIKLTQKGHDFLKNPWSIMITLNNDYSNTDNGYEDKIASNNTAKSNPSEPDDEIEKKNRKKAGDNLKSFGSVSDLLRMKKMKKS